MTEAHLNQTLALLRTQGQHLEDMAMDGTTDTLCNEDRKTLMRVSRGVLEAAKAFKDLWDERDDADRRAGAAARKIHQLQRQLDKLHEKKASAKKRRPWPRRAV